MVLKTEKEQIEKLKEVNPHTYKPNDEEQAIILHIRDRYRAMKNSEERSDGETDWDNADKAYRAYTESRDSDDPRSNINKPIPFAIIETELQETAERRPRPSLLPRQYTDIEGTDFANETLKYSFDRGDFDYQYFLAKKEALLYGTGILFEYYRQDKRTVKELEIVKNEGKEEEQYKMIERIDFEDCYAEYKPLREMYFDSAANHISKCRDLIWREILHIDEFKRIYSKKRGFYNVEYVVSGGDTSFYEFYQPPQDIIEGYKVEILHYFNRALDQYFVLANSVLVRNAPLPFPHKELPVVVLYSYKISNKFYGLGIPKIIKSLVEERNTLANLRLDYQKMGINKMFFYDDMIELDELDLVTRPFGGIPINTQGRPIDQVIRWIEYSDVKPSSYREEDILIEDIRRTTGIDDRVQGLNVGGTATEAAILKESSMKRINMKMLLMEIDSLVRLGRLRLANIAFFYPLPKIERIVSEKGEEKIKKTYKTIRIEGKKYQITPENKVEIEKIEGYSFVKIKKPFSSFLEAEYDVVFDAKGAMPISKPLKQAKITEMFDRLTTNPSFLQELDIRKAIKRYTEVNEEDTDNWLKKQEIAPEYQEPLAEAENEVILRGIPVPPTSGASEEHTKIHLSETKSQRYTQADPTIQQILEAHIRGEAENMGALGQGQGRTGIPGGGATQLPAPQINPADIMPNFQGREE